MQLVGVTDDDVTDKIVSVQVDDEESMIQFIDIPGSEVSGLHCIRVLTTHAEHPSRKMKTLKPHSTIACTIGTQEFDNMACVEMYD